MIGFIRSYQNKRKKTIFICPIMELDHDQAFLRILHDEKNIFNFLDAFFGFLYRCTDFYIESNSNQKLGFPPGMVEKIVFSSMYKWKNISLAPKKEIVSMDDSTNNRNNILQLDGLTLSQSRTGQLISSVTQQIEIDSCNTLDNIDTSCTQSLETDHISDSYNGAIREKYIWSQTLNDLNVLVKIPEHIKTPKHTKIDISSDEIKIDVKPLGSVEYSQWDNIFNGKLSFKVRKDESVWSIVPGIHISIHLEKAVKKWWEALIDGEPKIELSKIDCTKSFDDMAQEEQVKVQELIWNHRQKLSGKPTSEQIKMETILKQMWNAKDSPFQGTSYDPTILRYN